MRSGVTLHTVSDEPPLCLFGRGVPTYLARFAFAQRNLWQQYHSLTNNTSHERENDLCWLLGTSVLKIGLLYPMEPAFLPKQVRCEYNQQGPFCSYSLATRLFSRRRGSVSVVSAHLHEATHRFPLSHTSRTCALLDQPPTTSLLLGTLADLTRGKSELLAENALLRQQLIILRRQIKSPVYRKTDRFLLVVLARMVRSWKEALLLVQPETLLCWHRELFRVFWK